MSLGDQIISTMVDAFGVFLAAIIDAVFTAIIVPLFEAVFAALFPG